MIYKVEEASYGRIYQHTRDNGTFAIIGSEDKDTHKSRYDELKSLIKEYEKKYGHLGYNRLSGTYQYQLTGEKVSEKSVIIYDIELKDALSIAKKINQESIIWKENTFFGIIDVQGGVLERFKKSALNFSKAIKNGIGSKLMSDQTRDFGYAFEEVKLMRKNNLSESILVNLKEDIHDDENTVDSLCYRVMSTLQPDLDKLPHIIDNNITGYPTSINEIKNTVANIDSIIEDLNILKNGLSGFIDLDKRGKYNKRITQKRQDSAKYHITPNKIKSLANKTRDLMKEIIEKEKQGYKNYDEHFILEDAILEAGSFLNKELYLPSGFLDLKYALALAFWNNAEETVLKDLQEGNYDKIEQDWDFWKRG